MEQKPIEKVVVPDGIIVGTNMQRIIDKINELVDRFNAKNSELESAKSEKK